MKTLIKTILLMTAVTLAANAQFSFGLYFTTWTDGSYVYGEAEQQYAPGQNCSMCSTAYHTYSQSMALSGSDGSYNSCSNNFGDSASISQNIACTAQIAYDWTYGGNSIVYTGNATENDDCSVIGNFINSSYEPFKITYYHSSYQYNGQSQLNPNYCLWKNYVADNGCPGVSSSAPFSTNGCATIPIILCFDYYNNNTNQWTYREGCISVGPGTIYPLSLATCSTQM
jgi:hypothetical protein